MANFGIGAPVRMIDDLKESTGVAIRMTSLAAAIALAAFITVSFLCAAAFIYVLQTYGLINACFTGAAIFFVLAVIGAADRPMTELFESMKP